MAKTTIKITGFSLKEPKIRKDGVAELIFKIPMSKAVPKGLESLGESAYKVLVSPKAWNKFVKNNEVDKDTFYIVEGEAKASVTQKGVPFITIVCFNIQAKPKEQGKGKEEVKKTEIKVEENNSKQKSDKKSVENKKQVEEVNKKDISKVAVSSKNNWRAKINEDNLVEINISDIDIDNPKHKHANVEVGDKIGINSIIAVIKKDNGRYSLVTGYKAFISAKIYRENQPVKAYIYDKSREDFVKEFGIKY